MTNIGRPRLPLRQHRTQLTGSLSPAAAAWLHETLERQPESPEQVEVLNVLRRAAASTARRAKARRTR